MCCTSTNIFYEPSEHQFPRNVVTHQDPPVFPIPPTTTIIYDPSLEIIQNLFYKTILFPQWPSCPSDTNTYTYGTKILVGTY